VVLRGPANATAAKFSSQPQAASTEELSEHKGQQDDKEGKRQYQRG